MSWEGLRNWRGLIGYLADRAGKSRNERREDAERPQPVGTNRVPGIARPGSRPALQLSPKVLLGKNRDVSSELVEFCIELAANEPAKCRLVLDATGTGGRRASSLSAAHGDTVEITLDPAGDRLFAGMVYGLGRNAGEQTPLRQVVTAFDRLMELKMSRRIRGFEEQSRRDVLQKIAQDHALAAEIWDDGTYVPQWVQANESDYAFALRLVQDADCEMWTDDDVFHVARVDDRPGEIVSLDAATDFDSLEARSDLSGQRVSVGVDGWNPDMPSAIGGTGSSASFSAPGSGQQLAADILNSLDLPNGRKRVSTTGGIAPDADAAQASADARFAAMARRFVTLSASLDGNPRLQVGAKADITGLGTDFDGRYRIVSALHKFDREHGYTMEFTANRPGYGGQKKS